MIRYDAGLVEEAVLRAEARLAPADEASFRAERNRAYETDDPDDREARFEALHGRWFVLLGLDRPLHEALSEQPEVLRRVADCRVLRALSRREESADLHDTLDQKGAPALVVRLRPEALLEPERLLPWLRRELLHVADMLEPTFGYRPELPTSSPDPAHAYLLRQRYRVVWDVTVDGRLHRQGRLRPDARTGRLREFTTAFPMLGDRAEEAFVSFFEAPRPHHEQIAAFVRDPVAAFTAPAPP